MRRQTGYRDSLVGIFSKHESLLAAGARHEKIADGFVVDFEVGQSDFGNLLLLHVVYSLEQLLHGHEDYSWLLCSSSLHH